MKFFSEFKKFITRGNILDLAIGVIIGGAFSAIVTALTNKILMPIINLIVYACTGGQSVNLITVLNGQDYLIDDGAGNMIVNSACIYIDWGTFIMAIVDFLLIALVLFLIIKLIMNAQGYVTKAQAAKPTKEEKKQLKEQGVNMKDHKEVLKATQELREKNKTPEPAPKPTQEELLSEILVELKKQNEPKKSAKVKEVKAEEK